jgi:hypothetical protein
MATMRTIRSIPGKRREGGHRRVLGPAADRHHDRGYERVQALLARWRRLFERQAGRVA